MLQQLLLQFKKFSRENWWIYLLLFFAVVVVIYTWKGNIYEVIGIFFLNLSWAMCNMLMMSSYKDKKFIEGSVFILIANILYTWLSLYAWLHDGNMQYIYWQTSFMLTGIKAFMFYTYNINIKYISFKSIFILNCFVMSLLIWQVEVSLLVIIQSVGIAGITLWLATQNDMKRYFYILAGNSFVVLWTSLILMGDFNEGKILGITVAYALLGLSILSYNYKILPIYISRLKKIS